MANIDTGGHGGKKSVDQEVPLVPFIDLLLCCVMFLLVTAVWNQLAKLDVNQQQPGQPQAQDQPPPEETLKLILQIQTSGYTLASTQGDNISIPKAGDSYDQETLITKLQERRQIDPNHHDLIITPEDGVRYEDIIHAMDIAVGEGFPGLSIQNGSSQL